MKKTVAILVVLTFIPCKGNESRESGVNKMHMSTQVQEAFLHAWNRYKKYAWGHDALLPISKRGKDWYSHSLYMTPLDAFDTMILMGLKDETEETSNLLLNNLTFDHDLSVQVFEVVIRIHGGLISAYQSDGDERLLALANDLGKRLPPAFNSATGMPHRYVNLQTGAIRDSLNNSAEIGNLILEFGTLSKLTGNNVYYEKVKKAINELYCRKSDIGLVGTVINVETGEWIQTESHISGMIDSYYEHLIKAALLFDDEDFRNMWESCITPVHQPLADTTVDSLWYRHADMANEAEKCTVFGALAVFNPGSPFTGRRF